MTRILLPLVIIVIVASNFARAIEWENLDKYTVELPAGLILDGDPGKGSRLLMRSEVIHDGAASMVDAPGRIWLD